MVNFYNHFLKDKSHVVEPLHRLLEDKPWKWMDLQEKAFFCKLQELLSSNLVLMHFDEIKEVVINCDALPYGNGVVLPHRENSEEKPIAYWSRTLGKLERNYFQIYREALAILGVKQFRQYVAGREFTIMTDLRPLLGLLSPKKQIPSIVSPRMLRWCLIPVSYTHLDVYKRQIQYSL